MFKSVSQVLFALVLSLLWHTSQSQEFQSPTNDVLFSIGNENITSQEFLNVYRKNNMGKEVDMSEAALRDYLNLYINFRLKVKEAKNLKLDTTPTVRNELSNYRSQLAKGYLTDKEKIDQLTREAYDRMQKEIKVQHILVRVDPNASAADTLQAYRKAMRLRDRAMKGDFGTVARDSSEDTSAKENNGELGYITAMQVVYPFETAAYNTPVGKISQPVKTRFGYHIIKVLDSRANRGTVQVAHIFSKIPQRGSEEDKAAARKKIDDVYTRLQSGESFEDLAAQYSDDKTTSSDGGKLAAFSTGKMVAEFEEAAFNLKKPGDYTKPIQTKYGFHIIKLIERKPLQPYDEMKDQLRKQIEKDQRAEVARTTFINKLKREYNIQVNQNAKAELWSKIDSSVVKGLWSDSAALSLQNNLITLTDNTYNPGTRSFTQRDFARFVLQNQRKYLGSPDKDMMLNKMFDQFTENSIIAFEEDRLGAKYPAFRELMNEYNDGILLFELTDQKVWSKAVKDTAGLKAFYETVKGNYMSDQKARVTIYSAADQSVLEAATKMRARGTGDDKILAKLNKKKNDALKVEYITVERGKGAEVEQAGWAVGKSYVTKTDEGRIRQSLITEILQPSPKPLEEVRGYVVADYQEKLEKEWIQELRSKYPVKMNELVLMGMIKK